MGNLWLRVINSSQFCSVAIKTERGTDIKISCVSSDEVVMGRTPLVYHQNRCHSARLLGSELVAKRDILYHTSSLGENAAQKFSKGFTVAKVWFSDKSNANFLASSINLSRSSLVSLQTDIRYQRELRSRKDILIHLHPSPRKTKSMRLPG